jgi:hypothetical protein
MKSSLVTWVLALGLIGERAAAAVIIVGAGESIQAALDTAAASSGPDTVQLAAGEYVESITIQDAGTVILAGSSETVILSPLDDDGDPEDNVVNIRSGNVILRRLTLTGGNDGIEAEPDSPETVLHLSLLHVRIESNEARGLDADDVGDITILDSSISDNGNDGINVESAGAIVILGTIVSSNESDGIQLQSPASVVIKSSTVDGNGQDGIQVENSTSVDIVQTVVANNGGADPEDDPEDGIDLEDIDAARLTGVRVSGSFDDGLEIDAVGTVDVVDSSFSGNEVDGMDIDDCPDIFILNVVSSDNGSDGYQTEAENVDIEAIVIIAGEFSRNGDSGVSIVETAPAVIQSVTSILVRAQENDGSGFEILTSGEVRMKAISSIDNGAPDIP